MGVIAQKRVESLCCGDLNALAINQPTYRDCFDNLAHSLNTFAVTGSDARGQGRLQLF